MTEDKKTAVDDVNPMFVTLVLSLSTSAMAYLGKVPNPASGKIERDLDQARFSIELLVMLKEKTQGHLTEKENRMLANVLSDLKLNYADEALKDQEATAKAETEPKTQKLGDQGPEIILPPGASPSTGLRTGSAQGSAQAEPRTGSGKGPEIIKP